MEDVYLGPRVSGTRRPTLTESWDFPADWTPDSKWVILLSNRNGHMGIFKQSLKTHQPLRGGLRHPLASSKEAPRYPRIGTNPVHVGPDHRWALGVRANSAFSWISDVLQTFSKPVRDH